MTTARDALLKTWDDAWTDGLWYASWSKVLDDLTPQQVAWSPAPKRHSIWQIIDHMLFWREAAVRRATGGKLSDEEANSRNYRATPPPAASMLDDLRTRYRASHEQVRSAIADPNSDLARLAPLPYHDSYHIGQVMYIRALQGLKPIE